MICAVGCRAVMSVNVRMVAMPSQAAMPFTSNLAFCGPGRVVVGDPAGADDEAPRVESRRVAGVQGQQCMGAVAP